LKSGERSLNLLYLCLLALLVGVATGYGAVGFRALIAGIHNLGFLGQWSLYYDANVFTPPSPWGPWVILVPMAGAVIVTFLVTNFAPEAKGHGVPEVMDAVYYHAGAIRPVVVVVKSLASAISIGTGAAVGREGPIVQIGAAIASTLGGWLRLDPLQRITLVAAGAGGGIAATFNTPLGAVLFAVELMMPEVSVRTFMPVAISTGMATLIGRSYFGYQPAFDLPRAASGVDASLESLIAFAVLGLVSGLAATLFVRGLYWTEDWFEAHIRNSYLRHLSGMFLVGLSAYLLMQGFGHYYVEGVGYATIQAILDNEITIGWFLLLLFAAKLFATSVTLAAGASGGIFSPSLFLGATIGGAFGTLVQHWVPVAGNSVAAFAMVGGTTGAAMTAIIMIFEMTLDYDIVMPMIIAVAISQGVRRVLCPENIYTMKLTRRGHRIPKSLHANMFMVRTARDVMDDRFLRIASDTGIDKLRQIYPDTSVPRMLLVHRGEHITGVARIDEAVRATQDNQDPDLDIGRLCDHRFLVARAGDVMFEVINRMNRRSIDTVVVVSGDHRVPRVGDVLGLVSRDQIGGSVASSLTFRGE